METVEKHKKGAPKTVNFSILTVSDTRNTDNDETGKLIKNIIEENNHSVINYNIVKDDEDLIKNEITKLLDIKELHCIITNGGTGITKRDVTIEAIKPLFEKELVSFNPLFSKLSHDEIGNFALLSRATAGTIGDKLVFCLPGSPQACDLALNKLIISGVGYLVKHVVD